MYKTKRSGLIAFLLSLITFGIFGFVQLFFLVKETNQICKDHGKKVMNPLLALIFTLLTFGIFGIIWGYILFNKMNSYVIAQQEKPRLSPLSWLLSQFFGAFTLFIWNIILYFKKYALWNQMNRLANEKAAKQENIE